MFSERVAIVGAVRSPIGGLQKSLSALKAADIGAQVIQGLLARVSIAPGDICEVGIGQVLLGGQGQNPARQATVKAGLPYEVPAFNVSQVCGSGLRAILLGAQQILQKEREIIIAGGQESMSQAPHAIHLRQNFKAGHRELTDTMMEDGLTDAFHHYPMGETAENMAEKWSITRLQQDTYAADSHNKAEAAQKAGLFQEEIIPILSVERSGKSSTSFFAQDEHIREGMSLRLLSGLKPIFRPENGTVTAGNSSGLNDGAAMLLLMSAEKAHKMGLLPLAYLRSWANVGVDPAFMGFGPVPATQAALKKAGWRVQDLDLIEVNEAFAAQSLVVHQEMGWDREKVNVNGGAIALGHPIGASGARIVVTLVHEMIRRKAKRGLATLCIGGGMGLAVTLER